ncbi:hypothetical protein PLEOSDRAFT_1094250 [Pleurotus ostreatus PC15]|uniref:Uncharacterized protein n=1 Tax=Pleurotus ostreatus (strain PC15) TaxID=1137138 RepID=A0A067NL06_PLEO1|nr:hypothetical protein PLEOSDRAFT_1094250 [Pleurotus ostreatus PC15]
MSKLADNPEFQAISGTIVEQAASNSDTKGGNRVQEMRTEEMDSIELKSEMMGHAEFGDHEGREASSAEGLNKTEYLAIEREEEPSQLAEVAEDSGATLPSEESDFEDVGSQDGSEVRSAVPSYA